ncbi:MAG: PKD domain-containing protein [Bacteroidota bacterium]|nr:PKD domain-containing protein [Bacteroidota bacterium]
MKQALLLSLVLVTGSLMAQNADTLLYERFETGGSSFTINSADENGVSAAIGYNQWIINNEYTGGSGQLICSGFPTTFTVPNTPSQPAGITGGASTQYMHIISDAGQAAGILNCSFLAANGLCGNNEYNFSRMSLDVTTTGYDSVTVSFLWLCEGAATVYGELYYSTNGGTSWTEVTPSTQYSGQPVWTTQTVSSAAFAGHATIRFGFRFVNEVTFNAGDPGFAIDEFLITASNAVPAPVAAFSVSDSAFCESTCVDFTDLSTNNPVSWLWIFPGSSTSFSTQQNPSSICYATPGTYDVTLIVENSSGTDTLTVSTITVYAAPAAPVITASGDTLFATSGFSTYEWYLDSVLIAGATGEFHVPASNGLYSVTATDSNGCSSSSSLFLLNTGISEMYTREITVFPNPAAEILHIATGELINRVTIYDGIGKEVFIYSGTNTMMDISHLQPGCYLIKILTASGKIHMTKLLKINTTPH